MSLRILVVLPMYGGSLPIGRYCVLALRQMGHSVRVFDAPSLYPGYQGLLQLDIAPAGLAPLQNSFLRLVSQAIWQQADEQKPQMVLALAQAPLDSHVLRRMRKAGIRTVMWFVEDYRLFPYWQYIAPLYDAFAVIQKEPFLSLLARSGQEHAFYLPLAMLPGFHKKEQLSEEEYKEYGADIAFLGAGYPNRRKAFAPLAARDFRIWGSDWQGEQILAGNIQRAGARIGEDEAVKIYNATKINLNLHSSTQADAQPGMGDFVNPRTFELAGTGAFQLTDRRRLLGELFTEDEIATFSSAGEMYEKIDYFLAHPAARHEYAERARRRAMLDHTYEKRMAVLLQYIEKEFGPFQEDSEKTGSLDIPKEKLRQWAQKSGLAPDAGEDDILAALRRQPGILDSAEAAGLFAAAGIQA